MKCKFWYDCDDYEQDEEKIYDKKTLQEAYEAGQDSIESEVDYVNHNFTKSFEDWYKEFICRRESNKED